MTEESKWPCFWCGSMQAHFHGFSGSGFSTVPACEAHAKEHALKLEPTPREKRIRAVTGEWLEYRAMLERSLLLFDRIKDFALGEDCDPFNACENGESDVCDFDEESDEIVHNHGSCDCTVWDVLRMATDIRSLLERTMPPSSEGSDGR